MIARASFACIAIALFATAPLSAADGPGLPEPVEHLAGPALNAVSNDCVEAEPLPDGRIEVHATFLVGGDGGADHAECITYAEIAFEWPTDPKFVIPRCLTEAAGAHAGGIAEWRDDTLTTLVIRGEAWEHFGDVAWYLSAPVNGVCA
ncbi:MAG TPA: hypothetical protein VM889_04180 [Candidatus Thermoplasmatota archaeon]|nr:hypothetical protein [Candidatus Thermoplasmatota archaeon]